MAEVFFDKDKFTVFELNSYINELIKNLGEHEKNRVVNDVRNKLSTYVRDEDVFIKFNSVSELAKFRASKRSNFFTIFFEVYKTYTLRNLLIRMKMESGSFKSIKHKFRFRNEEEFRFLTFYELKVMQKFLADKLDIQTNNQLFKEDFQTKTTNKKKKKKKIVKALTFAEKVKINSRSSPGVYGKIRRNGGTGKIIFNGMKN